MVLCFVALAVFAVIGIFSARYRRLAGEAFGCVTRAVTLQPCEAKLDERLKAKIVVRALKYSPRLARLLNRNFKLLSFAFTILFFASFAYSAFSLYNYVAFGNCNGPESSAFCVFDAVLGKTPGKVVPLSPGVGPTKGSGGITLIEVGCFDCPYTRQAQAPLQEFLKKHPEVKLEFRVLPLSKHPDSFLAAQAAFCSREQNAFWQYHDALFREPDHSRGNLLAIASGLGLNSSFTECLDSKRSLDYVRAEEDAIGKAGIYGTPTFFINGASLVGPRSEAEFESALNGIPVQGAGEQEGVCHAT